MVNNYLESNPSNPIQWLKILAYVLVIVVVAVVVNVWLFSQYAIKPHVDWVLVGLYGFLAVLSFYFYVINDINAIKLNGRAMAVGFFVCFLALTLVSGSFVFEMPQKLVWYVAGVLLIIGYLMGAIGVTRWAKYHKQVKKVMMHENLTDELTGLFNRRAFAINANRELEFCIKSDSDFSVLILDIDDFKLVNDRYGHTTGDEVLKQLCEFVTRYTRKSDSIYRWGGEELVVLLPVTGLFEANQVAHKIIEKVAQHVFQVAMSLRLKLTVSVGLAQWVSGESVTKDTLDRADKALYRAKANGKNAVVVADYADDRHDNSIPVDQVTLPLRNK